jgi:hypothetical protein
MIELDNLNVDVCAFVFNDPMEFLCLFEILIISGEVTVHHGLSVYFFFGCDIYITPMQKSNLIPGFNFTSISLINDNVFTL